LIIIQGHSPARCRRPADVTAARNGSGLLRMSV
jgi:hypothetical protein